MQVIPVIDVKGGLTVAARRGDRARYAPLESPLAASAAPVAVATGLRTLFPFRTLYVADLDGIEGRGADLDTQRRLAEFWPGELWIDDGSSGSENAAESMIKSHVLGSESLKSLNDYEEARAHRRGDAPLSLDFRGDDFIGPPELFADASLWPQRVIVMTLARVGSGEGPDVTRLTSIIARAEKREIYAAGGVRDASDLAKLQDIGVGGALIATALHTGTITRADLERFAR
jgi:HisA/HisF family protein